MTERRSGRGHTAFFRQVVGATKLFFIWCVPRFNKAVPTQDVVIFHFKTFEWFRSVSIGLMGRGINLPVREHSYSRRVSLSGNPALHCSRCGCIPSLHHTIILARGTNDTRRGLTQIHIHKRGKECVSSPSLFFSCSCGIWVGVLVAGERNACSRRVRIYCFFLGWGGTCKEWVRAVPISFLCFALY